MQSNASGLIRPPALAPFFFKTVLQNAMSQQYQVPSTPRVISPSPTPSESRESTGSYFAPVTRSAAKRASSSAPISEEVDSDSDLDKRARARSRSPNALIRQRTAAGGSTKPKPSKSSAVKKSEPIVPNGVPNGNLSPASAVSSYWRDFSRSPSPLGLIPIHRHWRSIIHRHEIPRKVLHVSIGFSTLYLYSSGVQTSTVHPWLLAALVPIAGVDIARHRFPAFNRFYVRVLGALMRESEVNEKYNGVVFYLLGAWAALRFFPKDVGVMSVLLLSWCDTAASTFGRLYGRYTPRIRKGKSLAGSVAAAVVGVATATFFWGYFAPRHWGFEESFMFKGTLSLPESFNDGMASGAGDVGVLNGWAALGVMSLWSGIVASTSELIDVFGLDDNLTIPILSGAGLWTFLKLFGK